MNNYLNPNHDMAKFMEENWSSVMVALLNRLGGSVVLDLVDLQDIKPNSCIGIRETQKGLELFILDRKVALELARKEGGLLQ